MRQVGIIAEKFVASGVSWLSITGHGRHHREGMRVGFGDDAAVAGGVWVGGRSPRFVADAVADPMTGLRAGLEAARMLGSRSSSGIGISLAGVASSVTMLDPHGVTPETWARANSQMADPRARTIETRAADLGADNAPLHDAVFQNDAQTSANALSVW